MLGCQGSGLGLVFLLRFALLILATRSGKGGSGYRYGLNHRLVGGRGLVMLFMKLADALAVAEIDGVDDAATGSRQ